MGRQIAIDTINLKETPRLAHTEYPFLHDSLIKSVSGESENSPLALKKFLDAWDIDFLWNTRDEIISWANRGRVTAMGHAVFTEDARDLNTNMTCPFEDSEEVLEFNAVKEYGLEDFNELVKEYEESYQEKQALFKNQLIPGGYYKTLVSGASHTFGWDMFLLAAADQERFSKVLQSFGELTMHHVKAWAETSIEVFIQHDDMVWTEGPFMPPEFYRKTIFPIYKELWAVMHKASKKVLYCCDGTFDMFMEDIADAGADGFIFEPSNNFDQIVKKFGKTHCLVGSKVDCRTMAFDGWPKVRTEMDETLKLASECSGLIWAVGNHIPFNVPLEIASEYINYLKKNGHRNSGNKAVFKVMNK